MGRKVCYDIYYRTSLWNGLHGLINWIYKSLTPFDVQTVLQWYVKRFRSEMLRVRSKTISHLSQRRSMYHRSSLHVKRQNWIFFSDGSCWEIIIIKQIHTITSNILFDSIKAGATQTETSLLKQYVAAECVDLLDGFFWFSEFSEFSERCDQKLWSIRLSHGHQFCLFLVEGLQCLWCCVIFETGKPKMVSIFVRMWWSSRKMLEIETVASCTCPVVCSAVSQVEVGNVGLLLVQWKCACVSRTILVEMSKTDESVW